MIYHIHSEHIRLYWVYLIREKSEVVTLFKDFYQMIEINIR
jgi:hypothetical protein